MSSPDKRVGRSPRRTSRRPGTPRRASKPRKEESSSPNPSPGSAEVVRGRSRVRKPDNPLSDDNLRRRCVLLVLRTKMGELISGMTFQRLPCPHVLVWQGVPCRKTLEAYPRNGVRRVWCCYVRIHRIRVCSRFSRVYAPPSSAADEISTETVAIKQVTRIFDKVQLAKRALREVTLLRHFANHENITGLIDLDAIGPDFNEV